MSRENPISLGKIIPKTEKRKTALQNKIFCTTTIFGAFAFVEALKTSREDWSFSAIQEIN